MTQGGGDGGSTRFVVLACPRSGSNWLCSALDSHPEILCHHEIFNPKEVKYAVKWRRAGRHIGGREQRDADPPAFLRALWAAGVEERIVGFKINRGQDPRIFDAVLSEPAIRKVIVSRQNRVRAFVSESIALETGEWESYPWSRYRQNGHRIAVEAEALHRHAQTNDRYLDNLRARLSETGQTAVEIGYENLRDLDAQNRVLRHLGAKEFESPLTGVTERLNPAPLRDLIANFDALEARLRDTPLHADLDA